jgi:hypothetical protein
VIDVPTIEIRNLNWTIQKSIMKLYKTY